MTGRQLAGSVPFEAVDWAAPFRLAGQPEGGRLGEIAIGGTRYPVLGNAALSPMISFLRPSALPSDVEWEVWQGLIRDLEARVVRAFMPEFQPDYEVTRSSYTVAAESPGKTGAEMIDELEALAHSLGLDEPHPVAIWLVDCPERYRDFMAKLMAAIPLSWHAAEPPADGRPRVMGMPIYDWRSRFAQPGDLERAPSFCRQGPGAWVEMSDGNHRPVVW